MKLYSKLLGLTEYPLFDTKSYIAMPRVMKGMNFTNIFYCQKLYYQTKK